MAVAWRPGGAFPHPLSFTFPFVCSLNSPILLLSRHFLHLCLLFTPLPSLALSRMAIVFVCFMCYFLRCLLLWLSLDFMCNWVIPLHSVFHSASTFPLSLSFPFFFFLVSLRFSRFSFSAEEKRQPNTHTRTLDAHKIDPMKGKKKKTKRKKGGRERNETERRGEGGRGKEERKENERPSARLGAMGLGACSWLWRPCYILHRYGPAAL